MENLIQNIFYLLTSPSHTILPLFYNNKRYYVIVKFDERFLVSDFDIKYGNKSYVVYFDDTPSRIISIDEILDILQNERYPKQNFFHDANIVISKDDFNRIRERAKDRIK